ncbi:MAG: hypothetical protein ACK42D_00960 [Candidatus Paceibacteria bacterium]
MLQSKHSLERHRFFPYIAWTMVIGFSIFVYTIVQDLRKTSRELGETAARLEARVNTPPQEITDFVR